MALARRVSGAAHSERRILVAMDSNFLAPAPTMLGSQESTRPVAPVIHLSPECRPALLRTVADALRYDAGQCPSQDLLLHMRTCRQLPKARSVRHARAGDDETDEEQRAMELLCG
jgi:hypothetical protein